jgi:K+-sensing histidine kinase KdpD
MRSASLPVQLCEHDDAAAGVGKTCAMLESARGARAAGIAGKVQVHFRAGTAAEKFFREPNLFAFREMALRRTADRVDAAARECVATDGASKPWLARDRFLIAVAPDDQVPRRSIWSAAYQQRQLVALPP